VGQPSWAVGENLMRRAGTALILVPLALLAFVASAVAEQRPKVVIIGFDGADARLVERWMDEGQLPHLARLREEGTFAPLQPTNPPQTPVSWSSFATGTDPGKTQIFDFLKRNPDDYLPGFAMTSDTKRPFMFGERNGLILGLIVGGAVLLVALALQMLFRLAWPVRLASAVLLAVVAGLPAGLAAHEYLPVEVPDAINNRQGSTMWELASAAGLDVQVIRVPATFPAEPVGAGRMLSGLGVPDIRGRVGTPAFYTSDPGFQAGDGEFNLELIRLPARRGRIATRLVGPKNKPFYDFVVQRRSEAAPPDERGDAARRIRRELDDAGVAGRIDIPLVLDVTDTSCTVQLSGQSQTLRVGEWSEWFQLDFSVNPLVDRISPLRGIARFKLLRLEPALELYVSPINFHPDCHPVAFSWPADYSETLRKRFGLYKTIGWALDTWSLPSGVGDEQLFLADMGFTVDKYEELMTGLLPEEHDLYVQIFYFTDRIAHLFWRFLDPGHPLHDPVLAARYAPEVLGAYQRMDRIVGRARELAGSDAIFIVCSDHGFSSFRRGVNYNNWLVKNGFMGLKVPSTGPGKLSDARDLFADVDWSKTRAYAVGLGSIYINLIGREKRGIVLPGPEYEEVRAEIKQGLEALVDPQTGQRPVARVWYREEMYDDFDSNLIPDLRATNALDYRVSWQTSLGGFGDQVLEDNLKPWSGDHCSNEPSVVPGIFFSNRRINTTAPRMVDLMPTVLGALGLEVPAEVDGRSLF
jgi:predicted AlkP superfamily phosphohydrolase/phosphomutase